VRDNGSNGYVPYNPTKDPKMQQMINNTNLTGKYMGDNKRFVEQKNLEKGEQEKKRPFKPHFKK